MFDLDDTLYPEINYVKSGFAEVVRFLEAKVMIDASELSRFMETSFKECRTNVFDQVIEKFAINEVTVSDLITVYKSHQPKIKLSIRVEKILSQLRTKVSLAIVTDGALDGQQKKVKALGLDKSIDFIVYTDQWGIEYWKPHPKAFEHLMNVTGSLPHEILYVGDNPSKDFIYQKTLGIHVVQYLSRGLYQNDSYLENVIPTFKINDVEEIVQIIDTINNHV